MRIVSLVAALAVGCSSEPPASRQPAAPPAAGGTEGSAGAGGSDGSAGAAGSGGSAGVGGSGGSAGVGGGAGMAGSGAPGLDAADPAPARDAGVAAPDASAAAAVNPFVYVGSGGANQIRIFQLDLQTGALAPRGSAPSGPSPDYLAFHPTANYLYALNEVAAGRVVAFAVDPTSGALRMLNSASSGGGGPAHISVHSGGRWLLAANYGSGHAAALPIRPTGELGPPVDPVLAGDAAHMILDDGVSGRFVFVPSKGTNRVLQYRFDDTTGRLTPNDPPFVPQAGSPRHMVFHRSRRQAFLLTEAGRSVISYRYDPDRGLLEDASPLPLPAMNPRADGSHILIHPTRDILYASIRFDDRLAIFDLGADGRPTNPRFVDTQLARPWDFAIDPTGHYLLVANNDDATVQVFRIDEPTGALTAVGRGTAVDPRPRFVGLFTPRAPAQW